MLGLYDKCRALVFGGSVCTATDVAVRLGKLKLGSQHLTSGINPYLHMQHCNQLHASRSWLDGSSLPAHPTAAIERDSDCLPKPSSLYACH